MDDVDSLPGGPAERFLAAGVCQQQGWVRVHEVNGPAAHRLSCGQSPFLCVWEKKLCVLTDSQLLLLGKDEQNTCEAAEKSSDAADARNLRRTVSVPAEGQFPDFPPEGAAVLDGSCERSARRRSVPGAASSEKTVAAEAPCSSSPFRVPVSLRENRRFPSAQSSEYSPSDGRVAHRPRRPTSNQISSKAIAVLPE